MAGVGKSALYTHSRSHWQREESGRCYTGAECEFCQTGKNVSRQSGRSADSGECRGWFVCRVFRKVCGGGGGGHVSEVFCYCRGVISKPGAPPDGAWLLYGSSDPRTIRTEPAR